MKSVVAIFVFVSFFCFQETEWTLFKDDLNRYTIKYPSKWKAKGGKGGFATGTSTKFTEASWMLVIANIDDEERIDLFFEEDDLIDGELLKKEKVVVNEVEGTRYVITNSKKPDQYDEVVLLKTETHYYLFMNDSVRDENFTSFYMSFLLL